MPLALPHPLPAPPRPPVSLRSPEQLGIWVRGPDLLTSKPVPQLFLYSRTEVMFDLRRDGDSPLAISAGGLSSQILHTPTCSLRDHLPTSPILTLEPGETQSILCSSHVQGGLAQIVSVFLLAFMPLCPPSRTHLFQQGPEKAPSQSDKPGHFSPRPHPDRFRGKGGVGEGVLPLGDGSTC